MFFTSTLQPGGTKRGNRADRESRPRGEGFVDECIRRSIRVAEAALIVGELALLTAAVVIYSFE